MVGHTPWATWRAAGGRALPITADVAAEAAWAAAVERCRAALGPVDVLVCNAYAVDLAPAHAMPPSSWRHQLEANLTGAFFGFQACVADPQREGYSYSDDAALLAERST